jgi:hypothetical protein
MAGRKRVLGTFLAVCLAYYWRLREKGGKRTKSFMQVVKDTRCFWDDFYS